MKDDRIPDFTKEDDLMEAPGIKDFRSVIEAMKNEAHYEGKKFIEVNAKELHAIVSPNYNRMPTCCQAIYKQMLDGDEILSRPKENTGFGSYLTVRFYVDKLEERERMFPDKKRGRPAKSKEEKLAAKKAKKKKNTEELRELVKKWLEEHGWKTTEDEDFIVASNENRHWVINVQGVKRGKTEALSAQLIELLKHMDDASVHYSIAFNDSIVYRRQWNEIPRTVKNSLNISVILADKKGRIKEL